MIVANGDGNGLESRIIQKAGRPWSKGHFSLNVGQSLEVLVCS